MSPLRAHMTSLFGARWRHPPPLPFPPPSQLLRTVYQEELELQADLLIALCHIDLEACACAMLTREESEAGWSCLRHH